MSFRLAALIAALALPAAALAAPATTRLPLGGQDQLVISHPESWSAQVLQGTGHGSSVVFTPSERGDFRIVLLAMTRVGGQPAGAPEVEAGVRRTGGEMLPTAVQTELELIPVAGSQANGVLFHLTDRNPEKGAGDYRELHQGALLVGPYFVSVEVLTHTDDADTVREALASLAGLTLDPAPARP